MMTKRMANTSMGAISQMVEMSAQVREAELEFVTSKTAATSMSANTTKKGTKICQASWRLWACVDGDSMDCRLFMGLF